MKNKLTKTLSIISAVSIMAAGVMGCGSAEEETKASTNAADNQVTAQSTQKEEKTAESQSTEASTAQEQSAEAVIDTNISGTITLAGSTSMEKVCEALMEGFMETYTNVTVTTEYTGSGAGLESLNAGSVDIGNASRHLKEGEVANGAVENVIALDGIAVITDLSNTVTDLTSEQLASIYTGEITNWSEFGGADEAIVVIGRESGSGTRSAFEELLGVEDACSYAQELDSTGAVLAKVAATPGAIGYVSLDVVDDSVLPVSLDSVEPSEENIIAGSYKLSRPFVMATSGEISEQAELVQVWFAYINSEEGQEIIREIGLILPQ